MSEVNVNEQEINYCLYARKSSESDEKQALSIESQLNEMKALAEREGLNVVEIKYESKSAKDSSQRIKYNEMLTEIAQGHYDGILTWAPDRLSRNAGDLGTVVDLMDQGKLKIIKTYNQTFTNSPNEKFLLMILCSQAKLENDNKSVNVKRGMRALCLSGIRPGSTPLGYLLIRSPKFGEPNKIVVDHDKAPYIQQAFNMIVESNTSGRQVWEYLKKQGVKSSRGNQLAIATVYNMIRNPFYYGEFEYPIGSGNFYKGTHQPLITKEVFNKANKIISSKGTQAGKWGRKNFFFNRILKCGYCNGGVSGEEKFKPNGKRYVYYKCNKPRGRSTCEGRYVTEQKIIDWCSNLVDQIRIEDLSLDTKIQKEVVKINQLNQKMGVNKELTPKDYITYILTNGTKFEKREILKKCTNLRMFNDGIR